jgi:hypothetical protein
MGKLLIKGEAIQNKTSFFVVLLLFIFSAALGFMTVLLSADRNTVNFEPRPVFVVIGIVLALVVFIGGLRLSAKSRKNAGEIFRISVYEEGVEGRHIGGEFSLTYDQIESVEIIGAAMRIKTFDDFGSRPTVLIANVQDVIDVINSRLAGQYVAPQSSIKETEKEVIESDYSQPDPEGLQGEQAETSKETPKETINHERPHPTLGKLIAQGSGKGAGAAVGHVILNIILAVATFWFFIYLRNVTVPQFFGWPRGMATSPFQDFLAFAFPLVILGLGAYSLFKASSYGIIIPSCFIKIYEKGVVGRGVSKWIRLGDVRPLEFILTYDQISSVSTEESRLIVNSSGTSYYVYLANANEIRQAIHKQKT